MTGVIIKRLQRTRETGKRHVMMEAKAGMMCLQAKEYRKPPEVGRGKEQVLPYSL